MDLDELFTRREAIASGATDRELTAMVRCGAITRVARGVYRRGPDGVPDPEAVVKSLKVRLSHQSAAAWRGASMVHAPDRLHVIASRSRGRWADEVQGVRFHRADLMPSEIDVVRRIPTTTALRAGLDIARVLELENAVATLDSMARGGLFTPREFSAAAAALPIAPGRQAILTSARLIDPRAESVFESIGRTRIVLAGLPTPEPQVNICDRHGVWIARVDLAWRALKVLCEFDGFEYHDGREAFERDRRRWTALSAAGWKVIVMTWRAVMDDPTYFLDVIREAVA